MKNLQFLIGETEGGNLFKTQVDGKLFLISGQPTSAYFRSLTLISVIIADSGIIKYFLRNIGNRTVSFCGLKLKRNTEFKVGIRNEFRASRQTRWRHT